MKKKFPINKVLYVGFTVLGFYYLLTGQYEEAPLCLGVALAFDPFDQKQTWDKRPLWKKLVPITHLAIIAAILGYTIGFNDK